MSQFAFLKSEFAEVHGLAAQAEGVAASDPRAACVYARLSLENGAGPRLSLHTY